MKYKLVLFASVISFSLGIRAQISTNSYYNGYWGQWKSHTTRYTYFPPYYKYSLNGGYSGFIIYSRGDHPSEYIFKFDIYGYWVPDKKEKKEHIKNNEWYEYSGFVEYYVTEKYPTIEAVLKTYQFPYFNSGSGSEGNPCARRKTSAKIQIAPYKNHPKVYNIWFDGVGVAIDMEDSFFPEK